MQNGGELERKTFSGVLFKSLERVSVQIVSLVISIFLARLLSPTDYGVVAMANVVIELLNVFINYGLGTALIHKKDSTKDDETTCFFASLSLSIVLYALIFVAAYPIAAYCEMPELESIIKILGLQVFFTTINSVQVALISKRFLYRQMFLVTLISNVCSGVVGIACAYLGLGAWALVIQSLLSVAMITVILAFVLRWVPTGAFSKGNLKEQIRYSWRLLIVGFVDCLYAEIRNVLIAKKYSSEDLAFYNRGSQFPKIISNSINQSIISVLFPAMSTIQDDENEIRKFIKKSISFLTFFLFPLLFGLIVVAEPLIEVLLTEKWIFCVPYMQILCFAYIMTPLQSVYKQALKAHNDTKLLLYINIAEKALGILFLIAAMNYGVEAICWSFVFYHIAGLIMYMISCTRVFHYGILQQLICILPNLLLSIVMAVSVWCVEYLCMGSLSTLLVQILLGIVIYVALALLTKNDNMIQLKNAIKKILKKQNGKN